MLFSAGGLFALYEGVQKIRHPHHLESPAVALVVLVVAIGLESFSLRTAIKESRHSKGELSWFGFIRRAKVPELPVVLLEDVAALTPESIWDALSTCGIGLLLISVAVVLVIETKSLLLGEAATPETVEAITANLVGPGVQRVIHLRTMHLSPDELLVAAKLAMPRTATLADVAAAIDGAEARVRAAVPTATVIYLEPDIDRAAMETR
jgi:divalent metal cation (Fe/Co/Zn/Cd) transporter